MARKRRIDMQPHQAEQTLRGNRRIKPINHLIEKLHRVATQRDHAGN
jgi:hypothetical protein